MKHAMIRGAALTAMLVVTVLLWGSAAPAAESDDFYQEPETAEKMLLDISLLRPLGIVGTAVGSVAYVVSYPFAALGGNTRETYETLVADPARYTFQRPLGHFEKEIEDRNLPAPPAPEKGDH